MKLLRRVFVVVLAAAFGCFNVQALDLHVHGAQALTPEHQHGPALHHHDAAVRPPAGAARLLAIDADDTVIPVLLSATTPAGVTSVTAWRVATDVVERPAQSMVAAAHVVERAHSPPSSGPSSLRAPPASLPL